ncbi:MAG TPA: ABC transporter permease [Iamia sp.]|jgi:ABC-type polysaccharide/polyol phosphate export permease|nr:ABC transporter permease [Iamia sp.]
MTAPTTEIDLGKGSTGDPGPTPEASPAARPSRGLLHDTWVLAKRGLIHMKRQPEQLSDATIQPIMFVVLFAFVFGGSIRIPGFPDEPRVYREFLLAGIMAQTLVFTAFGAAMSIANDQKNQAIDRFRSLPIARGAVIAGYAVSNLIKTMLPIIIMSVTGYAIGWRIRGSLVETVSAYGLAIAFAFAMIWVGIWLGAMVGTPEGVTGLGFAVIFPLTFIASTFVPLQGMPGVVRTIAEWNPVTTLSDSLRELFGNPSVAPAGNAPWSLQNPVLYSWIWVAIIICIFAPLAVRAYTKKNVQ